MRTLRRKARIYVTSGPCLERHFLVVTKLEMSKQAGVFIDLQYSKLAKDNIYTRRGRTDLMFASFGASLRDKGMCILTRIITTTPSGRREIPQLKSWGYKCTQVQIIHAATSQETEKPEE
jgi:hypothetical protein